MNNDELYHYGMPRRSGRYPWGSGKEPFQHSSDFLNRIEELKSRGFEYVDEKGKKYTGEMAIAKAWGMNSTEFRIQKSLATQERKALNAATAKSMREHGYSLNEIAKKMGYKNDSSVRALLKQADAPKENAAKGTVDFIRDRIKEKGIIDVGVGVERELGISRVKMDQALYMLEREGYPVYKGRIEQVTNRGRWTTLKVIGPPDTEYKDIYDPNNIHSLREYISKDSGKTFDPVFVYPKSMDSKRLEIKYAEDGGIKKDGLVEIRRGVQDLSLGNSNYAQVRILVDNDWYIKGMAVYADDLPDGVDVRFNTNKSKSVAKMDVLKKIKNDPDNPFGSLIKEGVADPDNPASPRSAGQSYYIDKDGKKQLSLINKRAEEGDWGSWSDKLPAQFLAKQSLPLMKQQLKIDIDDKKVEFEEIKALTNPAVKKKMLSTFANDCDSAAVDLQAASMPRQKYQVILPLTSIKDTEIYAPNYKAGESVALIRFPHGGTFEIPILTVNNKNREGKNALGANPMDAVGINSNVANRLSGADFDGDTVMVIPIGPKSKINSTKALKDLENFDTKIDYGPDSDKPVKVDKDGAEYYQRNGKMYARMRNTQTEMGKISNLITDMTLKGAGPDDLAKAVKHSMVVIDAEKHKLDYKQSFVDNDIARLKKEYMGEFDSDGKYHEGASTLISRSKSKTEVLKSVGTPKINQKGKSWYDPNKPEGALIYKRVKEEYVDDKGRTKMRTEESTKMAETDDAYTLVSGARTPQELAYAEYANTMKAMANEARKEQVYTPKLEYDPEAGKKYKTEVESLKARLNISEMNAPRERMAQILATSIVDAKLADNPDMTKKEKKKLSQQALTQSRAKVGAKRRDIMISDTEWEAIQSGAIHENTLMAIMNHVDSNILRQRATPKASNELTPAKISRIEAFAASGYTTSQIASKMGISVSTVNKYLHQAT